VRSAGKLAGLKVLRVLNEPTAAALAYGLGRTLDQTVAIYDLGGGTFDISIIRIKDKIFEVIATGGDTFLGGVDFDDRLMQHVLSEFLTNTGIDLSYDRRAVTLVRQQAEDVKIKLSSSTEQELVIPHICDDEDGKPLQLRQLITRAELEKLTADLVERSIRTCERILQEADCTRDRLDEILLVGGQSRMPLVRSEVEGFLGRPPSRKVHPDEAVAIGAAIMAHSLVARGAGTEMTLLDALPMAIGIGKPDGKMFVLFPKNQQLPAFEKLKLTTARDNQTSIKVEVYQGESRYIDDNELLGRFIFSGLRPATKGTVTIEVYFDIDSEGILNLSARDTATEKLVESQLKLGRDPDAPKRRRRRKKKEEEAKKAPEAPPSPLNMPTSSLLKKDPLDQLDRMDPDVGAEGDGDDSDDMRRADDIAPLDAHTGGRLPPAAPTPDVEPTELAERKGLWARFAAWWKGLFSRGE
jgi:molecular chaperone DnaK